MIEPYYTQYALPDGTFDPNEEPSNWYKKMYGVTTTWQMLFNADSSYFRTEGSLANTGRSNGLQGDAGRNATGSITLRNDVGVSAAAVLSGVFAKSYLTSRNNHLSAGSGSDTYAVDMNLLRAYTTANEFRTINRLIRVYKLLTINGKAVNEIMAGD